MQIDHIKKKSAIVIQMLAVDLESDPGSCNHHDLVMVCDALCATLKRVAEWGCANFSPSFDDVPNIVTSQKIIPFLPLLRFRCRCRPAK